MNDDLPVAVIGAGPVGLAAAAQLVARGMTPLVFDWPAFDAGLVAGGKPGAVLPAIRRDRLSAGGDTL